MSARIGEVNDPTGDYPVTVVSASSAGVEVTTEHRLTYTPIAARNYAALLVRAADEVERMRGPTVRTLVDGKLEIVDRHWVENEHYRDKHPQLKPTFVGEPLPPGEEQPWRLASPTLSTAEPIGPWPPADAQAPAELTLAEHAQQKLVPSMLTAVAEIMRMPTLADAELEFCASTVAAAAEWLLSKVERRGRLAKRAAPIHDELLAKVEERKIGGMSPIQPPRCECGLVFAGERSEAIAHAKKTKHTMQGLFYSEREQLK